MTITCADTTITVRTESELIRYLRQVRRCQPEPLIISPLWVAQEQAPKDLKLVRKRA